MVPAEERTVAPAYRASPASPASCRLAVPSISTVRRKFVASPTVRLALPAGAYQRNLPSAVIVEAVVVRTKEPAAVLAVEPEPEAFAVARAVKSELLSLPEWALLRAIRQVEERAVVLLAIRRLERPRRLCRDFH